MHDNHWSHRLKHFEWPTGEVPLGTRGTRLETGRLDLQVGPEVISVILKATDFANDPKECFPFQVGIDFGIAPTDAGLVVFLLRWVAPVVNERPFALCAWSVPRSAPQNGTAVPESS
jgi:hypothetical protein